MEPPSPNGRMSHESRTMDGKVAIVRGAAGGIGRGTAPALAGLGGRINVKGLWLNMKQAIGAMRVAGNEASVGEEVIGAFEAPFVYPRPLGNCVRFSPQQFVERI